MREGGVWRYNIVTDRDQSGRYIGKMIMILFAFSLTTPPRTLSSRREGDEKIIFPSSGLTNDDLALADGVVSVPLNPAFSSLNLAQAVLILGYEWLLAGRRAAPERLERNGAARASKAELANFCSRLEMALDEAGFFFPPEKRPTMTRNLRSLFGRMDLTDPEVKHPPLLKTA